MAVILSQEASVPSTEGGGGGNARGQMEKRTETLIQLCFKTASGRSLANLHDARTMGGSTANRKEETSAIRSKSRERTTEITALERRKQGDRRRQKKNALRGRG